MSRALMACTLFSMFTPSLLAKNFKWTEKQEHSIVEFTLEASGEPFDFDANGDDFDILVAALIATDVIALFNGENDFTVFAPNDQAFYLLTNTDNDTDAFNAVVALLEVEGIEAVLAYHVTAGVHNSRNVTRTKMLTMLDGNTVMYDNGLLMAAQSDAMLINIDNRLEDGMVHIIDTVLLPTIIR
ncbi:fasciclin domain-containing protein [Vibrio parahaemolyticus]|nr:fasciclin domain-containing protein [Vibrio parahaemolyticus]